MKIAIINDTHFGVKNGSDIFLSYTDKFFADVFFPYCIKNNIKHILHLGDYFDHRKFINIKVLQHNYDSFISKLYEYGMTMDVILGNHDVYFKNTNELNSLYQLLRHYDCITVHETPTDKIYDELSIALLPWITADNYNRSIEFIQSSKSSILVSHLELSGFKMLKGSSTSSHGMDPKIFHRYEMVLSGHYHTKSERDNIHYLGTQYELTWADAGDPKHFHVLDTQTRSIEAIQNQYKLFQKLYYDEDISIKWNDKLIENTFIKVIVTNKKDYYKFDKFLDKLHSLKPYDVKIVESYDDLSGENVENENISVADTPSLLNSYVDAIETDLDAERLKKILYELYVEAQTIEAI